MIELRQLLFNARISQAELLKAANKRARKKVHQSRISLIMNGYKEPTEYEKNRIRLALIDLGFSDAKILKVKELVSKARAA